jgi:hypothetical protein
VEGRSTHSTLTIEQITTSPRDSSVRVPTFRVEELSHVLGHVLSDVVRGDDTGDGALGTKRDLGPFATVFGVYHLDRKEIIVIFLETLLAFGQEILVHLKITTEDPDQARIGKKK